MGRMAPVMVVMGLTMIITGFWQIHYTIGLMATGLTLLYLARVIIENE